METLKEEKYFKVNYRVTNAVFRLLGKIITKGVDEEDALKNLHDEVRDYKRAGEMGETAKLEINECREASSYQFEYKRQRSRLEAKIKVRERTKNLTNLFEKHRKDEF